MQVGIIGAGVIGLTTAYFLRKEGASVTVFDRGLVGSGASRGNAGEICPSASDPLPSPDMLRAALTNLFSRESALYVWPTHAPEMLSFFMRFARASTSSRYETGLAAMDLLNRETHKLYDQLAADGVGSLQSGSGYLSCFMSKDAAIRARAEAVKLARRGLSGDPEPLLGGDALHTLEPALASVVKWGYVQHGDEWIDPMLFLSDLAAWLRGNGVVIHENTVIRRIREDVRGVTLVGAEPARFDKAILAAGAWSEEFGRALGVELEVRPGKGYSFSLRPPVMPQHLLSIPEVHLAGTPMGDRLRVAGTMEFDGTYERMNYSRIDTIYRGVSSYLGNMHKDTLSEEWVGPRPMTPDGLPHLGHLPGHPAIIAATGHNMLGISLGPSSGAVAAGIALGTVPEDRYRAFSPGRFARRTAAWRRH